MAQATPDPISKVIEHAVKVRLAEIVQEETETAIDNIRRRIGAEMDTLALNCLQQYEMSSQTDRLIITVRKPDSSE